MMKYSTRQLCELCPDIISTLIPPTVPSASMLAQNKPTLPSLLCILVWPYDKVLANRIVDRGRSCMHVYMHKVLSKCTYKESCLPSALYSFLLARMWTS